MNVPLNAKLATGIPSVSWNWRLLDNYSAVTTNISISASLITKLEKMLRSSFWVLQRHAGRSKRFLICVILSGAATFLSLGPHLPIWHIYRSHWSVEHGRSGPKLDTWCCSGDGEVIKCGGRQRHRLEKTFQGTVAVHHRPLLRCIIWSANWCSASCAKRAMSLLTTRMTR